MAPGIVGPGTTAYIAAHNQIRAHAKAYRAYQVSCEHFMKLWT